jgi:tRNA-modifying protein YgfZ
VPKEFLSQARDLIKLTGRDRLSFLQGMVTNDVLSLTPGQSCYAFHLTATGQIVADLCVLVAEEFVLLDTEPGWGSDLIASLEHYLVMERVKISTETELRAFFVRDVLVASALKNTAIGIPNSARIYAAAPPDFAALGAVEITARDFESLRIESGIPLGRVDFDNKTLAPETGQASRAIHYKKGCYVGQEIVARIDARGHTNRTLVGFYTEDFVTSGSRVLIDGKDVGWVTSSAMRPIGVAAISLGYLRNEHATPETIVMIDGKRATVASLPFGENQ